MELLSQIKWTLWQYAGKQKLSKYAFACSGDRGEEEAGLWHVYRAAIEEEELAIARRSTHACVPFTQQPAADLSRAQGLLISQDPSLFQALVSFQISSLALLYPLMRCIILLVHSQSKDKSAKLHCKGAAGLSWMEKKESKPDALALLVLLGKNF